MGDESRTKCFLAVCKQICAQFTISLHLQIFLLLLFAKLRPVAASAACLLSRAHLFGAGLGVGVGVGATRPSSVVNVLIVRSRAGEEAMHQADVTG